MNDLHEWTDGLAEAMPLFMKLNDHWNADPNAPEPALRVDGSDVLLSFALNRWLYPIFSREDVGILRFLDCTAFRVGDTNDEGWYRGQCRYGRLAPSWGEFYEITGDDEARIFAPQDWVKLPSATGIRRHFLFYFRDETAEILAAEWQFDQDPRNALLRLLPDGSA